MKDLCERCGNPYSIGDWPYCPHGVLGPFWTGSADIHDSQKVAIFVPPDGSYKHAHIAGSNQQAVDAKREAFGFTRKLLSRSELKSFTEQRGLLHEASHYDKGSATAEHDTGSC